MLVVCWGGVIQLFKPKFSPNYIPFTFKKEKYIKYYYIIKYLKQYVAIFFQSDVISHLY